MMRLTSSAPHIYNAKSIKGNLVLWYDLETEVGILELPSGEQEVRLEYDWACYVMTGSATTNGSSLRPDSYFHFKAGWQGKLIISETLRLSYMRVAGGAKKTTDALHDVQNIHEVKDWGVIPTMLEGESRGSGVLLSREEDRRNESGIWTCTSGKWQCEVTSDEYCHFLSGSSTYVHESGETIEIKPDTLALFPKGWKGVCTVHETIRKVYLIR
jgi:uncharacterized protein